MGKILWDDYIRFFEEALMLKWGIIFAIIAVVAGLLGFSGLAGASAFIAKVIFFIALVVIVVGILLIKYLTSKAVSK